MNIRCPQCQTVFRVNPERIPASGVKARCARCGGTFTVHPPSARPPEPQAATPPAPSAPPPAATPRPPEPVNVPEAPAPQPSATHTATADRPFGARDPRARAERLARALVSDIVAYHPDRRDRSLASGNLRAEFREEIMKSWEEYVAQVGLDLAKSTPYFRDALNRILAKGEAVF